MTAQTFANALIAGLSLGLVAMGFSMIYRTAQFFHVAHAATYLVGAYTGIWLSNNTKVPICLAALASIIVSGTLGLMIEVLVYRPLRKLHSSSPILFLASLALLLIIQNVVGLTLGSEIQTVQSRVGQNSVHILGSMVTHWQAISIGVTILLFIVTWSLLRFTVMGKKMRAIATNPDLAEAVGISCDHVLLFVILLGSALAGIAGFLAGYDTAITPTSGFGILLIGVTAAVAGGIGSISGAILGGILVGIVQHFAIWKLPAQWQDAIVFLILIAFLMLRPQGFFGSPIWRTKV